MEEALYEAAAAGQIVIPLVEVDFSESDLPRPVANVSSLHAPHRLADAILRDSVLLDSDTMFKDSEHGRRWGGATLRNATPIYELCPTALLFGLWGSPEKPGGLGAKFERAIVSEIVGIDCLQVDKRCGFRVDPVGISKHAMVVADKAGFRLAADATEKGAMRPSAINHGNIIFESRNAGVRCRYFEQTTVLSLPALRKLRFQIDERGASSDVDSAARTVLAALGLCGATLAFEAGLDLRSRCLLWPTEPKVWQLLATPGEKPRQFLLDADQSTDLLRQAISAAEETGLKWRNERLILRPSPQLIALVRRSQELAAADE